jgi:hypothetical protein
MSQLTGAVLVEIVGRDVIAWRMLNDERHYLYSIDTTAVTGLVMADAAGPLEPRVVQAEGRTIVEFKKRSSFYMMLYRRNDQIESGDADDLYFDNWRFDSRRLHAWLFPQHAVVDLLEPPELHRHVGRWQDRPLVRLLTPSLLIEARYHIDANGFAAAGLPAAEPPRLQEIATRLALPDPMLIQQVWQHIVDQPAGAALLAGTTWRSALVTSAPPTATDPEPPPPAPWVPPAGPRHHVHL